MSSTSRKWYHCFDKGTVYQVDSGPVVIRTAILLSEIDMSSGYFRGTWDPFYRFWNSGSIFDCYD